MPKRNPEKSLLTLKEAVKQAEDTLTSEQGRLAQEQRERERAREQAEEAKRRREEEMRRREEQEAARKATEAARKAEEEVRRRHQAEIAKVQAEQQAELARQRAEKEAHEREVEAVKKVALTFGGFVGCLTICLIASAVIEAVLIFVTLIPVVAAEKLAGVKDAGMVWVYSGGILIGLSFLISFIVAAGAAGRDKGGDD